jgi:integrase
MVAQGEPAVKLTKRRIDEFKPGKNRLVLWDSDVAGFGLRVSPSGERSYVLKYRYRGAQRWFTIGRHGSPWTVDGARKEARRLLGEVAKGNDPAAGKGADRQALTITQLCDLYLAEGVSHKKHRGRIERHIKPLLGRRRVDAVNRGDIERLIADVANGKTAQQQPKARGRGSLARGGLGVAGQCATLVGTLLAFAVQRGMRTDNPARGLKKPPIRKLERFLSEVEIGRLAVALDDYLKEGGNLFAVAAIKLLLLSGARRNEILSLEWRDVDLERQHLRLRDSKTREKVVLLSAPAVALLQALPRVEGNPHVIVGSAGSGYLKGLSKIWGNMRARAALDGVRLHDLRHSFASIGAGASLGLPIIGKLLGHTQPATTARYAHLAPDPVRRAAETIGATIAAAMGGTASNVVSLAKSR